MVEPPIIISVTHVPPDRYIVGNRTSSFPNFSPENGTFETQDYQYLCNVFYSSYYLFQKGCMLYADLDSVQPKRHNESFIKLYHF